MVRIRVHLQISRWAGMSSVQTTKINITRQRMVSTTQPDSLVSNVVANYDDDQKKRVRHEYVGYTSAMPPSGTSRDSAMGTESQSACS